MSTGKLSAAHAFDYIVLRVNPDLTNCEDFATPLAVAPLLFKATLEISVKLPAAIKAKLYLVLCLLN